MVVVAPPGCVVVGPPDDGAVVVVLVAVVVVAGAVVVVVVDAVVVVEELGVVAAGEGTKMFLTVVPPPVEPKIDASGFPAINSTAVTNISESTNTMAAVPAMAGQLNRRAAPGRGLPWAGRVRASSASPAGASAIAETSNPSVRSVGAEDDAIWTVSSQEPAVPAAGSVGAEDAPSEDAACPVAPVAPSLRRRVELSGARTATCLTACWPRSIDAATNAVPRVAAMDPMATPTMVPFTPKLEAMSAASTAPAAEARIWRPENFTERRVYVAGARTATPGAG